MRWGLLKTGGKASRKNWVIRTDGKSDPGKKVRRGKTLAMGENFDVCPPPISKSARSAWSCEHKVWSEAVRASLSGSHLRVTLIKTVREAKSGVRVEFAGCRAGGIYSIFMNNRKKI